MSPVRSADNYLAAAEALSRSGLDSYLSIKAPALGFSPELVAELLQRTRSAGVRVHFDSLSPESAERTLALIAAAAQHDDELGITLPRDGAAVLAMPAPRSSSGSGFGW